LIKNKKNLLNLGFYNHRPQLLVTFDANSHFLKIKQAMVYVVEAAEGTGRRARLESIKIALKTGTCGDKKIGLDAVMTGFFPADKPQYVFAFRLEHAGKAEWRGAQLVKQFLTEFYQLSGEKQR